jgi:hypothetical protein
MSEELNSFKIEQLNVQLERLINAVDKICDRIEQLEKESWEKSIYRKFISFLYVLYPAVMLALIVFTDLDRKTANEVYNDTQTILSHITEVLRIED